MPYQTVHVLLRSLLMHFGGWPHRRWLALFVVLGFGCRVGLAIVQGLSEAPRPGSDNDEYDTYAWNLAQGRGYRGMSPDVTDQDHLTAYRPPGTSVVWAGLYRLFGHRYHVIRLAHCVVGALTILVVYGIGRRTFGDTVGLLASGLYTFWPAAILYSPELLSETLGTLWLLWYVLAGLRFADRPGGWRATWAGLLLGCALLTRGTVLFMFPLTVVWAVWQFHRNPRSLLLALWIPVLGGLCLTPWIIRNYQVFGRFIPLSTMGGSVLLQANNRIVVTDPVWSGYPVWDTKIPEYAEALREPNDEIRRDEVAKQLALQWLGNHPEHWWFLVRARFLRSWTPFLPNSPPLYRWGMLFAWGPVLLLFVPAFFASGIQFLRRGHPGWLLHLCIGHFVVGTIPFAGITRYRFAIEALCLIFAVASLVWLAGRRQTIARPSSPP
ncbi:glycosyltransferase family 39 protein [bacterium]|nr:glycosyltransferase family 39 protein [bacterium]